jgi:hypothetical protein
MNLLRLVRSAGNIVAQGEGRNPLRVRSAEKFAATRRVTSVTPNCGRRLYAGGGSAPPCVNGGWAPPSSDAIGTSDASDASDGTASRTILE